MLPAVPLQLLSHPQSGSLCGHSGRVQPHFVCRQHHLLLHVCSVRDVDEVLLERPLGPRMLRPQPCRPPLGTLPEYHSFFSSSLFSASPARPSVPRARLQACTLLAQDSCSSLMSQPAWWNRWERSPQPLSLQLRSNPSSSELLHLVNFFFCGSSFSTYSLSALGGDGILETATSGCLEKETSPNFPTFHDSSKHVQHLQERQAGSHELCLKYIFSGSILSRRVVQWKFAGHSSFLILPSLRIFFSNWLAPRTTADTILN